MLEAGKMKQHSLPFHVMVVLRGYDDVELRHYPVWNFFIEFALNPLDSLVLDELEDVQQRRVSVLRLKLFPAFHPLVLCQADGRTV